MGGGLESRSVGRVCGADGAAMVSVDYISRITERSEQSVGNDVK